MSDDLSLLVGLTAFAFILGVIAGMIAKGNSHEYPPPRDPVSRDVRTPGHKLVATPVRIVKPSSAWPMRESKQRVQSQQQNKVERGLVTGADDNAA